MLQSTYLKNNVIIFHIFWHQHIYKHSCVKSLIPATNLHLHVLHLFAKALKVQRVVMQVNC